jgi:TolB protein
MLNRYIYALLLLFLATYLPVMAEKIDLEVYASKFDSIPVAVLDFRPINGSAIVSDMPWQIIADDLEFSGRFHVVRMQKPDKNAFVENGIGIFIDGEYTFNGNEVLLDCFVHDASTGEEIAGRKFKGERKFLRSMAHRYSNQVLEMLFAEKGPFESRIVYVEDRGSQKNLAVMDYDGYNVKKMTSAGVNIFPAFVDSNTIVWTAYFRGKPDLYKGSISTGKYSIFVFSRFVQSSPSVSAVTGTIAYASSLNGNLDIYSCDRNAQNKKQLTFHRAIDTSPAWSPDGYRIAFTSDRSGQPQIYVMDADGSNTARITSVGKYQDSPAWSPRADKIAYTSLQNNKFDIWLVNPDGTGAEKLTSQPGNNENPSWSSDGSHIIFSSSRYGKSDLYTIRPNGSGLKQITTGGNAKMPDWSPF